MAGIGVAKVLPDHISAILLDEKYEDNVCCCKTHLK
jgi:hypothetical protein